MCFTKGGERVREKTLRPHSTEISQVMTMKLRKFEYVDETNTSEQPYYAISEIHNDWPGLKC